MAETGSLSGNVNAQGIYYASFGTLPHGTKYQEVDVKSLTSGTPSYKVDLRAGIANQKSAELKALETTTGGAGTAGYALVPVYVDPRIVDETRKYTPIVEIVPRVTNQGMFADWNNITAKGGAFTAAEDAALAETNTSYARNSTEIKFLYSVGRVTGPAIAAIPSYSLQGFAPTGGATGSFSDASAMNAKQLEVLVKTREIRELEENLIINGDATGTPTEYDGIIQIMGTTNTVDKLSQQLLL